MPPMNSKELFACQPPPVISVVVDWREDVAVKLVPFLFQTVVAEPLKPVIEPTSQSPEVVLVPLPVTDQPQMQPLKVN